MNKRNIWLDSDPGIDDAAAYAIAFANRDRLNILGLSTVAGNQSLERVTDNARKLSAFLGAEDLPVIRGADRPLVKKQELAEHIHGKTGLGNYELPETDKQEVKENLNLFLRKKILELPEGEKLTLVPTGPLTNIAIFLKAFPELKERIDSIVLMGGAAVGGNVTPCAEFNIWADPEAAEIVFASGVPIVMCGLDVTQKSIIPGDQIRALLECGGRVQRAYGEMLDFYLNSPGYKWCGYVCLHDAVTICWLLHPQLFGGSQRQVFVNCSEGAGRGMTVCDTRISLGKEALEPNALVLDWVDADGFRRVVAEALASYDRS